MKREALNLARSDAAPRGRDPWTDLETVTQSEVSQKEKNKYCLLMHVCGI